MVEYAKERLDNGSEICFREQIQRRRCPRVRDAFLEGRIEGGPSREPAAVICHPYGCSLERSGSARDVEPDDGSDNEGASGGTGTGSFCKTSFATAGNAKHDAAK